ncbi:AraC family transcriptional regulator [Pectobacterium sp. A5351]|uniref:AraC family transcriptional regulator n=1 Tax=Pectobacterium sp. A5351 TaxID=2914983 RepID=UPI00232F9201|nr:AraC family transcriptional regulator [Pectobacterium sp. A5351]WCG84541.1 AraC family transcriptional regulator [Pectobacterium sp. A5351]
MKSKEFLYSTMPTFLLRSISDELFNQGIDPGRAFVGLPITQQDVNDPYVRIPVLHGQKIIQRALQLCQSDGFGLRIGASHTISTMGPLYFAFITSPTLHHVLDTGLKYQGLIHGLLNFSYKKEESRNFALFAYSTFHQVDILTFLIEEAFSFLLRMVQEISAKNMRLIRVDFSFPPPSYVNKYRKQFNCDLNFNQSHNALYFQESILHLPIPTHDRVNHKLMLTFLDQQLERYSVQKDIINDVSLILYQTLEKPPMFDAIARQLALSERTLRRRLADCGKTYLTLLDDIRKERALALLYTSQLSIEKIGLAVGFDDIRSFRRAFTRWTGKTPRRLRAERHT